MPLTLQRIITASDSPEEPVSLTDIESHLRLDPDSDVEGDYIETLIVAARERVEEILTGRCLLTQNWTLYLDAFPARNGDIRLPRPPLQLVTEFTYLDGDGVEQELAEDTDFVVDAVSEPARISPIYGGSWPGARLQHNAIRISYLAGYENAAAIPQAIKHAIVLLVAHWYADREGAMQIPEVAANLCEPYRVLQPC